MDLQLAKTPENGIAAMATAECCLYKTDGAKLIATDTTIPALSVHGNEGNQLVAVAQAGECWVVWLEDC